MLFYIEISSAATGLIAVAPLFSGCFHILQVPLSEYIRRRRMTEAAFDLQTTDLKIIDVAMKYGYDSHSAFNRAFHSVHNVSPSAARDQGIPLKAFPRISFTISIKGDVPMNYRIERKEAIRIVGGKEHLDMKVEERGMFYCHLTNLFSSSSFLSIEQLLFISQSSRCRLRHRL